MLKGIFFDMDGTLLSTEENTLQSWKEILVQKGIMIPDEIMHKTIGLSEKETYALLSQFFPKTIDFMETAIEREKHTWELLMAHPCLLKDYAQNILELLKKKGYRLALVTSSRSDEAIPLLKKEGIIDYFEHIITGDEVEECKPSPVPYKNMLLKMGLQSDEVIAIEDSASGILSATRANIKVAYIPDLVPLSEQYAHVPTYHLTSLRELVAVIEYLSHDAQNIVNNKI